MSDEWELGSKKDILIVYAFTVNKKYRPSENDHSSIVQYNWSSPHWNIPIAAVVIIESPTVIQILFYLFALDQIILPYESIFPAFASAHSIAVVEP